MSDFWERLDELINVSTNGVDSAFEKKSGLKGGYIRKTINEKRNMKPEFIKSILDNHENLNKQWLMEGKGEMFLQKNDNWKTRPEFTLLVSIRNDIRNNIDVPERYLKDAYIDLFDRFERVMDYVTSVDQKY